MGFRETKPLRDRIECDTHTCLHVPGPSAASGDTRVRDGIGEGRRPVEKSGDRWGVGQQKR